jgi:hypothetical protein
VTSPQVGPVADQHATTEPAHASTTVLGNLVNNVESALAGLSTHVTELEGQARIAADHALNFLQQQIQDARNHLEAQQGSPVVGQTYVQHPSPLPASPIQDSQEHPGGTASAQQSRAEAASAEGNDDEPASRSSRRK